MISKLIRRTAAIALIGVALVIFLAPEAGEIACWLDDIDRYHTPQSLVHACLVYTLCLAIPFMPGVEIGLLIMAVFGEAGIFAAYLSTM